MSLDWPISRGVPCSTWVRYIEYVLYLSWAYEYTNICMHGYEPTTMYSVLLT